MDLGAKHSYPPYVIINRLCEFEGVLNTEEGGERLLFMLASWFLLVRSVSVL